MKSSDYLTDTIELWLDNDRTQADYWKDHLENLYDNTIGNQMFSKTEQMIHDLSTDLSLEIRENSFNFVEPNNIYAELVSVALNHVNFYNIAEHMVNEFFENRIHEVIDSIH